MAPSLADRLQFEEFISGLSARFIRLLPDAVDNEIETALIQIREFFQGDQCALLRIDTSQTTVSVSHVSHGEGIRHVQTEINLAEHFPWVHDMNVVRGETVRFTSLSDLPPEATQDVRSFMDMEVRSSLCIPLTSGSGIRHSIVLQSMRQEMNWPEEYVPRLRTIGEIFVNALERKEADLKLRESEARLALAVESASLGLWEIEVASGRVWVTDKARELFGYAADDEITLDDVVKKIFQEDRIPVSAALKHAQEAGTEVSIEYRVNDSEGASRWLFSRGRCQAASGRIMGVTFDISERKKYEAAQQFALNEASRLRDQAEKENIYLREQLKERLDALTIVGESKCLTEMLVNARRVASTDSAVLITGETGTGKELIAQLIHDVSSRAGKTMVTVNCAALPPTLIESELFGREKGAYTGAMTQQIGRFEVADGSTLFLDEVSELPLNLQAKLLRVLEEGTFERLGSIKTQRVNVRLIAATNRALLTLVKEGLFRSDLYYRLNVFPIDVPPLRSRSEDIPSLVWHFVRLFSRKMGKNVVTIPRQTMDQLRNYPWPGNIRELRNTIERAVILTNSTALNVVLPVEDASTARDGQMTLEEVERSHIIKALELANWRIRGKGGAAERLGVVPTTLHSKLNKLGISRR